MVAKVRKDDPWYWLAWADMSKPVGQRAAGVSIVQGRDHYHAIDRAKALGCYQEGVLAGLYRMVHKPPKKFRDRALTPEEVIEFSETTAPKPH